jgi:transcription elongation factor GreA
MSSAEYIPCARTCGSRRLSEVEQEGVASRPVYVTNDGLDGLLRQLSILIASKKPELLAGIQEARRLGTDEDQKLEAMTDELTIVEGLIRHLRNLIRDAVVIDFRPAPDGTASVGARVRLRAGSRQETFWIVGRLEADPSIGLISNESFLGEALLGHCAGDQIEWRSPGGVNVAIVLSVE